MSRGTVALWVLAGLLLTTCEGSSSHHGAPLPRGAPEVDVVMREYSFGYKRPVPAGRVVFRIQNRGTVVHYLTLVPLPEDMPPIDVQLHGPTRRNLPEFAGIRPHSPGTSGTFAVDLVRGQRYAMLCFVATPDGENHALKGMSSEFRAGG